MDEGTREQQGSWLAERKPDTVYGSSFELWGDAPAWREDDWLGSYVLVRSRQDCEDLIALLERVKERLPDGR